MGEETSAHALGRLARVLIGTTATIALVVGAFSSYAMVSYLDARDKGTRSFGPDDGTADPAVGPCVEDVCNYLLLGSDSRRGLTPEEQKAFGTDENNGGVFRSDTIMLVQLDPRREKAVVLSFPRDLWVQIPGRGWDKINTSFEGGVSGGGPLRVAQTIHRLTGLKVNHFLYVDLLGFQQVVDTLGEWRCASRSTCRIRSPARSQGRVPDLGRTAGARVRAHPPPPVRRRRARPEPDRAPAAVPSRRDHQLLAPQQIVRAPGLVKPVLASLKRDDDLAIADLAYLVGRLRGLSTGAVEFRAVPAVPGMVQPPGFTTEISVLHPDPTASAIFRALRNGSALPAAGTERSTRRRRRRTSPSRFSTTARATSPAGRGHPVDLRLRRVAGDHPPRWIRRPGGRADDRLHARARGGGPGGGPVSAGVELREVSRSSSWEVALVATPGFRPDALGGGGSEPECIEPD